MFATRPIFYLLQDGGIQESRAGPLAASTSATRLLGIYVVAVLVSQICRVVKSVSDKYTYEADSSVEDVNIMRDLIYQNVRNCGRIIIVSGR